VKKCFSGLCSDPRADVRRLYQQLLPVLARPWTLHILWVLAGDGSSTSLIAGAQVGLGGPGSKAGAAGSREGIDQRPSAARVR